VGDQEKSWALHICRITRVRLLTRWVDGSRHVPFAAPKVSRETITPLFRLLLFFNKHNRDHLQIQTCSENIQISHLYWELHHKVKSCLYQSLRKMWLLAMTTVILMNIKDSQKGTMFTENWHHLKQAVYHLNFIYWHKEILMTLSVIWTFLKKQELSSSRTKGGIFSTKKLNVFLSKWPKRIQRISLSRKRFVTS
jgi:hypothetical protein